VTEARSLCKESGRLEVCDSRIGEMLAYAPGDMDQVWPCTPVRNFIEKVKSEDLDRGLQRGIYNKRGSHWKSMNEGGKQEYSLAKQYADFAEKLTISWPRLAAVLRNVSHGYEREAQIEDEQAQPH